MNYGLVIQVIYFKMEKPSEFKIPMDKSAFQRFDKRDSGYLTHEPSPATPNKHLQFSFDEEVCNNIVDLTIPSEDVGEMSDDCFEDEAVDIDEIVDKEVERAMSPETMGLPIPIARPSAPAPFQINTEDHCISGTENFTSYRFQRHMKRSHHKCYFRPIGRRTISTQTPHQHSQILQHAVSTLSDRFHPYEESIGRGTVHNRLRHNSDDYVPHGPLPDVIPIGRDRSVSLPDVPAWREAHETEIGKELRRISDEFHFSYHTPRQARILIRPRFGCLPGAWNLGRLWDSLRDLFTPSPATNQ